MLPALLMAALVVSACNLLFQALLLSTLVAVAVAETHQEPLAELVEVAMAALILLELMVRLTLVVVVAVTGILHLTEERVALVLSSSVIQISIN
jgi:hypothetical protein